MKKHNKILLMLLAASIGFAGLAGVASARGGFHGGYHGGYGGCNGAGYYGGGGPAMSPAISPEAREALQKAHTALAPLYMELQAKKQELSAKIYGGADDSTVKGLISEVNSLEARLTEGRAEMQKQMAKAGLPMNPGMMNCASFAGGYHGHGWKGGGYGGPGYHGGGCPYMRVPGGQQ